MARPARGGDGQHQHFRRLRGHRAHARHVQEEGARLMGEGAATPAWVLLAYLVSGMCFILALRGLSSPESSRRGNRFGMFGMALALVTTLVHYHPVGMQNLGGIAVDYILFAEILVAILVGATIGLVTARRIAMTAM